MKNVDVVCAVIKRKGKYLISKRVNDRKWEFLGGKIEYGETREVALHRELLEEINCESIIGGVIFTNFIWLDSNTSISLHFYSVELLDINISIDNLSHTEHRWVIKEDMSNYDFMDGDLEFIKYMLL